ncbi:MAG TPA: hypothetical protein VM123_21840 [archaeon]|nr:hypothetical protein [archaeon]
MIKPGGFVLLAAALYTALLSLSGCRKAGPVSEWMLQTDSGPAAWDTSGTVSVSGETYLDRGERKDALLADAASGAVLRLAGPMIQVTPGKTVSFRFALRSERGMGALFEARLELFDEAGALKADSLLYNINASVAEDALGMTRPWRCYTRALKIPSNTAAARAVVLVHPAKGKVWLGETALVNGEDWMAYAATFSSHLGRKPEDKYVYTAGRIIESQPAPQPGEKEIEAGLLFFERKELVGAWPYANPRDIDRVKALDERVPRGAVAPFAFGVKALEEISGVEVSVSVPPAGENGELKTKPALYQGRYAATRLEGSWSKVFGIRTRLLEGPSVKPLPKGENLFFWLDVPVDANAAPGTYEGQLTIQASGRTPLKVPFRIEVCPVDLPSAPGDYTLGVYYYPPDDPALIEVHLKDMAAHGIHSVPLAGSFVEKTPAGNVRLDYTRIRQLDSLMALMRKYGFYRPTSFYVADLIRKLELPAHADDWTEQHKNLYQSAVRLMDDTARQWGWCKLMFFPVDEPANNPEHMKLAHLTLGLLRSMKEITPLCDLNTPSSVEALAPYLDLVVMQISSVSPNTVSLTKGRGIKTFFYLPAFGSSDVGSDAAYHRSIPAWFLPRSGTDGIYYFAYQSVTGDPYDELDGANRDWCAAYPAPAPDYIWPSPEWQGIRRGIEDLRLVVLARELISRCKAHEEESVSRLGAEAGGRLEAILNSVKPSGPEVIYQLHNELETHISEKWRQELLDEVIRLRKALKEI